MRYKYLRDPRLWITLFFSLAVSGLSLAAGWRTVVEASVDRVRQSWTQDQLEGIDEAIKAYRQNNHALPRSLSQLRGEESLRLDEKGIMRDIWRYPIVYSLQGNTYRVMSYGRDGKLGGTGLDCDLSNTNLRPPEADMTFGEFLHVPAAFGAIFVCLFSGMMTGCIAWSLLNSPALDHAGFITLAVRPLLTFVATLFVTTLMVMLDGILQSH